MKKRISALILILTTLFASFTFTEAKTSAEQRIDDLDKLFPTGSYFSVNGKACTHGTQGGCNNCELTHILKRDDLKQYKFSDGGTWTCLGFAKFAWYFIHGKTWSGSYDLITKGPINYNTFKTAIPGDMIFFMKMGEKGENFLHAAIFCGNATSTSATFFQSNSGGTNRVSHGTWNYSNAVNYYGSNSYVKVLRIKGHTHSYNTTYESNHPHKEYKQCSCGDTIYTDNTKYDSSCTTCNPPTESGWSDWSDWSTTYVAESNTRKVQTKTQYGYYHYVLSWSGNPIGAYAIDKATMIANVGGTITYDSYHEHWSDTQLTPITTNKAIYTVNGVAKTFVKYPNVHCTLSGGRISSMNNLYSLDKTRTLYRYSDKSHTHSYSVYNESNHPHAEYKKCTSCGDTIYTGNTKTVDSCVTCFPPHVHSYSTTGVETSHPHKEYMKCSCGDIQYTGVTTNNSSCEICNPPKKLPDLPDKPVVTLDTPRSTTPNQSVDFHWNNPKNADYFEVRITNTDTDEKCYNDWNVERNNYSLFLDEGNYAITIVAINKELLTANELYYNPSDAIYVSVSKPTEYVLAYNANGGIEPPSPATVKPGTVVSVSREEPQKDGYKFIGWSERLNGNVAYEAGDNIIINDNIILYAVWKRDTSNISLTIGSTKALVSGETKYNDVAPVIRNGRTMLPARFVAENLGATVTWDGNARKVVIKNSSTTIEIFIDSTTAYVNGVAHTLDSAAFIENGRTYTPVRFICENLGASINWDDTTKTVTITK